LISFEVVIVVVVVVVVIEAIAVDGASRFDKKETSIA